MFPLAVMHKPYQLNINFLEKSSFVTITLQLRYN